ncbi:hypothetical protein T02_4689 [Trichinella nativa]|uniref:Integrase catalytic domain-containing protein n=1 Tax=Trichinella nativa TaxID=6335 RepID=A0A0V1LFK4_9BILA|nr:hypothetical protein T02_4689 [Trichinella nativa]
MISVDEEESASEMVAQLRKMMKLGGFLLTKWASYPNEVLADVPFEGITEESSNPMLQALGITWNAERDELSYPIKSNVDPNTLNTKRQLICTTAKMIMQQGVDWDEKLPDNVHQEWKKWRMELMDIPEIRIRRCLIPFMRKEIRRLELHAFDDASKLAYGAAVYLVAIDKDGKRTVNLVLAKAKVAPLKQVTLPRLELMVAFTAAKLIAFVKNNLGIRNSTQKLKPFIQNGVEIIRQLTSPVLWRHCPTKNNSADLSSRGSTHGPPWLMEDKDSNFESKDYPSINLKIDEYHPSSVTVLVNVEEDIKLNPERFEDFEKLIRVTAYCRRFLANCRHPESNRRLGLLTLVELQIAENYWIRKAQRECFANEIQQLLNGKRITSNSQLIHLDSFLDENGLMRINGQLQNSTLPEMTKHPLILPDKHPLTRVGSKPFVLKMAPLPADRIQPTRPFENTGLDLAGPLLTRNGKTVKKSYILIFTCMTTRAVHLEVVSDMTVVRVMEAIRRFIARHGKPRILQSDNFRSFKQLDQELQLLSNKKMADCLEKELSAHRIQWKFITERAPWMGRYWETLVDEEGLSTIRCDIEARINARPLTYLSEDLKDPEVLTPYHFLPGTKFMDLPEVNPEDEEWVPKLKLLHSSENNEASKVRDIVSIEECNVPRNKWKLGRIIAVYPGKDGIARTAK